ncbi:hypothetical protein ASE74_09245 [Pedobacter sp. Leaf216]|uniref:DUF2683 family protein n=1 Tax=Pedobacter sp. Leaf216 TaxID=1735684 RepID=UPI00070228AB|nr:DUF2683 family protein [Pedobacter sp. Leaf216]KQM66065.1 hypothetical protein ASE74_09245 [Pedobacter sp. Leaf216]
MTIIAHPKNKKQEAAVEAVLKALNVSFQKEEESPYNPEFVAKVKERSANAENGNATRIKDPKNIWESIL